MMHEPDTLDRLREQAEEALSVKRVELEDYSQSDLEELVHELRVHQVELEHQNEALRTSQAELQVARDEYERLYDEAPVGYVSVDDDGRIVRINRIGAHLLGGEPAVFVGRPFNRYVTRASQEALHLFVMRLLRTRGRETEELMMHRSDGCLFRARIDGRTEEQSGSAWGAAVSDVTQEGAAEEALAASETRYRQLVQYAPAAIYEVEVPSGRFLTVNDVMSEITGYSRGELLSMTGFDVTDDEGRKLFAERLRRMAAGLPVPESVEFQVFTKDGRQIPVLLHTRLIVEDGRPSRIFVVGYDITERKRTEDDLRLIVQGTAALTGRDFFRALVRHLARLLDARYVLVGGLERAGPADGDGVVRTRAVWADGDWADNFDFDLRDSACARIVQGEECSYAAGLGDLFPADPLVTRWEADSYRALPLRDARNQTLGVLVVMGEGAVNKGPRTEPILSIFADRAAAELVRQRSERSLRRYADQQAALYAVASTLTTTLEPAELLDRVLGVMVPLFGVDVAWVTVVGNTRDEPPVVLASHGLPGKDDDRGVDLASLAKHIDACPACSVYRDSAGHAALRVVYDCDRSARDVREVARLQSHACLPLVAHGSVLGSLTLGWRDEHVSHRTEERLLLAIGYQVALSLHNARLYQHARQVNRLYVLAELNDSLATTLDPVRVATTALQSIAAAAHAARAVLVPYADSLGRYSRHVLTGDGEWIDLDVSEEYRGWRPMLDTLREPQSRQEGMALDRLPRAVSRTVDEAGQEFLFVPIDGPDGPLADMVLAGRTFTEDDVALARAAAGRTAQAIRNAHLYEEVRRLLQEREETQAQLVHSEKMAALGRLTASVSHEINNPVQAVLGCLGLAVEELDEDADQETVDRYLAIAMQELRRIATIVRRMREFYRPADHEWDEADINDTLEAVVELTRNDLMGRDVQLDLDLGQVPAVPIRPDQIRQVFLNLILNASDAMPDGGMLVLRTRLDELHLGRRGVSPAVRVEFEDTGTGIAPDVRARLFEPFFTTKREGSGLGLYISHGIVEAHEGEIEVESREGEGTIVRVWLPLSQAVEPTP